MSMKHESIIDVKNVAICMYGQYRTGDACLEYIKKFYQAKNVNIDFFCSVKEYETTYTRLEYNKNTLGTTDHLTQRPLDKTAIEYQSNQIKTHYQPKKFEVYKTRNESILLDMKQSILHSKVLSAWAESIMLKQQYEAENNMTYDLVIMQRYDVIVWPSFAFEKVLYGIQGLRVGNPRTIPTSDKNIMFFDQIGPFRPEQIGSFMYPNGQDLWVWGLGNSLDVWVYEALQHIPSGLSSNYTTKQYNYAYPYYDTHEMLACICKKMNIPTSVFPLVSEKGAILPLQHRNTAGFKQPNSIVIRDSYWEDGIIPDLVALGDDVIEELYNSRILDLWMKGI